MAASIRIHGDIFEEATGVVGKIEQAAELVLGALKTRFIVIVLFARDLHAEFESVDTAHPAHGIAKPEGVLCKIPGSGTCLADTQNGSCITQTASIEIDQLDLRDSVVGLAGGLELVKSKTGEIKAGFVNQDGGNGASPSERTGIVLRGEANVFKAPISSIDASQVHKVGATKKLFRT